MDKRLQIDAARMRQSWEEMAGIGATPGGGVTRLALTHSDAAARSRLVEWYRQAQLEVRIDDVGTIYGWRRGARSDLPPVVVGSHLDTVLQGGRFDGVLGVLAALEIVRTLNDADVETETPLVIVDFTNEEGARFEPAMLASGVLAGAFSAQEVLDTQDRDGIRFGDELERIGYVGQETNRLSAAAAYFELHIEQGPVLEELGRPIGLVTGIQGIERVNVVWRGEADHAGPTPMHARRDALVAAARFIVEARELAMAEGGAATVGRIRVQPDIINVIPGVAALGLDLRHEDERTLDRMSGRMRDLAQQIGSQSGVQVDFQPFWRSEPVRFSARLLSQLAHAAADLDVPFHQLISGAGHDAKYMAEIAPTAMIFVRTTAGRSHCEEESADWQDCVDATNVLLQAVLATASDPALSHTVILVEERELPDGDGGEVRDP